MGALNAQRQLNINTGKKAKAAEKLSSGYAINRAADDAAGLAISEKMRKQVRGLTQGVENTQAGVSLCQVADGALAEVHDMLQRMNELSIQSANGTNSYSDRQAIQEEINQLLIEIDRVGETTTFNAQQIFDGSYIEKLSTSETARPITEAEAWEELAKGTFLRATSDIEYNGVVYDKDYINSFIAGQSTTVAYWELVNNDLRYDGPNGTHTKLIMSALKVMGCNDTLINQGLLECNGISEEEFDKRERVSKLIIKEADDIVSMKPQDAYRFLSQYVYDISGNPIGNASYYAAGDIHYQVQEYARNNTIPSFKTKNTSWLWNLKNVYYNFPDELVQNYPINNSISTQKMVLDDYMHLRNIIEENMRGEELEDDRERKCIWIQSGCDVADGISLEIDGMSAEILGITDIDVSTEAGADDAMIVIGEAIVRLSASRSKIGAQQNRLEHTIDNENNIVENTTAAESRIRDTDMAKLMVENAKNNILEQATQSMLAQSNQSTQGVLSLLK